MAGVAFGNFQVDMRSNTFLDALIGHNFDQLANVSNLGTEFDEFFTSGARIVLHGNFTLGLNSTITGLDMFNPGSVLLMSINGLVGVSVASISNATPAQATELLFGQLTDVTTQGFDDFIIGDNRSEIAHAGGGHDVIQGNGGDDVLDGQAGADDMSGGTGNDTYFVDNVGDTVTELFGQGLDTVHSVINFVLPADVEKLILDESPDALNGTGNALNNTLLGNSNANTLSGGGGNDTLDGGAGADTLIGGAGDDTYIVDNAQDIVTEAQGEGFDIEQSSVSRTIDVNVEQLILVGGALDATGDSRANTLSGNAGDNGLDGGRGGDTMAGGLGNDTYKVDSALDQVNEALGQGNDQIIAQVSVTLPGNVESLSLGAGSGNLQGVGNAGDNTLIGNGGANLLDGGAGNDILQGQGGVDTLVGGVGNDTLSGGTGRDVLVGGLGMDHFLFDAPIASGTNVDQILDFVHGQDVIDLSVAVFNQLGEAGAVLSAAQFVSGPGAIAFTADQHIIHDSATGMLYYDADGNGAQQMLAFAQVNPGQALVAADLHTVA